MAQGLEQAGHLAQLRHHVVGGGVVAQLEVPPPRIRDDRAQVGGAEVDGEGLPHRRADQLAGHVVRAHQLALVFELELAGERGQGGVDVGYPRHDHGLLAQDGPPLRVRDRVLEGGDGQALADPAALVDLLVAAGGEGDALRHLADVAGHAQLPAAVRPGLLLRDGHALLDGGRVVRADLAADAVLEGRDDLAARGVVLRVGREHHGHVDGQAHRVAFDLDVAFLEDVEEADLDAPGEVGQLVEGEDAAVRARAAGRSAWSARWPGRARRGRRGWDRRRR
jgi:hypothetical protein